MQTTIATPGAPDGGSGHRYPPTICVDLDGTLVRTDTLVEGLAQLLRDPRRWVSALGWLFTGRAGLKKRLSEHASLDARRLPYEQSLIAYLEDQRSRGRRLVLATAADRRIAEDVNAYLKLFDEVIASDGVRNLKGRLKGDVLVGRFGAGNFTYVGNSRPDLHVWRRAGSAVLVNVPDRVANRVARITSVERRIENRPKRAWSLLKALRPHQWVKNLLVFMPILTANAFRDGEAWAAAAVTFMAFCATASAVYVVNDVTDLDADRGHPRKRRRPFASGDLPVTAGLIIAPLLLLSGAALGVVVGTAPTILFYAVCSLAYSIKLKELPLVDVFTLAVLYTLRLFAGAEASGYGLSPWLLAFSIFLFLGLATTKRVGELIDLRRHEEHTIPRRGYHADDIAVLQAIGVSASFVSTTVLALFVQSDSVAVRYERPQLLWIVVLLMLFWQCRLWLSTARGYMPDDPIVYAAKDWVSRLIAAAVVVVFLLARGFYSRAG
jgi:4-hydroxybenzoate polyprenyltransferase